MNITRIMLAATMAAGLTATSLAAAQASVTATIDIVNNNVSTTIYHAKNPPSTQSDSFSTGLSWTTAPPDSLLAGASDATAKITLGASQMVTFTYGAPNSASTFLNYCTFTVKANQNGTGLLMPTFSSVGTSTSCGASLPTGQPYNVKVTIAGF